MTTTSYNVYQQITSVRVATTANLSGNYYNGALNNGVGATLTALSVGALSIDGILLEVGDRVLIKNQTLPSQNGLYVVQSAGSFAGLWMLERAPDFQSVEQLKVGQYFTVGAGDTLAGSMFVLVEPLPETIGMNSFTFVDVGESADPSGPFLLKSQNLRDVANPETAFQNLGTGTGESITITDGDFVGGVYQIPVPYPYRVVCNTISVASQEIRLPVANIPFDSPSLGLGPVILMVNSVSVDIALSDGTVIDTLDGNQQTRYVCQDKSTAGGSYIPIREVNIVNSNYGRIFLSSDNLNANDEYTPTNYTPTSGVGFPADSITGNLKGIDAAIATLGGGVIPSELIFVDAINGSDTNTGSISSPLQTYEAARLLAVSRNPQYGSGQTIVIMTTVNMVGDMTISPFVSVVGFGKYCQIMGMSGNMVLDPLWGSTPFAEANISNIALIGQSINFVFNTYTDSSIVRFENCSLQLLNAGPTATFIGSDGSGSALAEWVIFLNCTLDLQDGLPEPQYISENVNLFLLNSTLTNIVDASVTSATVQAKLIIQNSFYEVGNITLTTTSTGTLETLISASNTTGSTLTLDGTQNTVNVDSTSYQFGSLVFANGATLADINLVSLSDGINANENFTPANYTPVATADYKADSVTGNLKGIDNALAGFIGSGIQQQLWVNDLDGNDANTGGISDPFKTYDAARTQAALTASPTNRFLIIIVGDQTAASPVLSPYIDLEFRAGTFTVTGGLGLDASWDTVVNNETVTIKDMKMDGFWVFNWIGNTGNIIRFLNCDHGLTTTGNFISNPGASNALQIINDTSLVTTSYSGNLFLTNSSSVLFNASVGGEIRYDLLSDGYATEHYLLNSSIPFGIVVKKTIPNTSTQNIHVRNTPMPVNSPVLEDEDSNVYIDADSYLNTPTFFSTGSYANIITQCVNAEPIYIYKNSAIGNDSNNGSINSPLATYEAARLLAISRGASSSKTFVIKSIGGETITGDMTLSPNISVEGTNPYVDGYIVNGDVIIDPDWGLADAAYTQVRNMYMYLGGGDYLFTFTNPQVFSFLKFMNVAMNTGGFITITGSGDASGFRETVVFENCTNDLIDYADGFIAENVDLFLINTDISVGSVTVTASSTAATAYNVVINNARFYTNNISVVTNNTSTLTTRINACNMQGRTLTIDGTGNTVIVDSSSYMFTLALANGATLSDLELPTKTDGMTNSSYSPTQYTPAGDTLYAASTLTGNLKGIDNALAGKAVNIPYQETSSLTNVMVANNEYTANNAAVVSLTLPITAAVGSTIRVNGKGAGGWRIDQQNAGHVIHVGAASTTVGAGGSLASATQFASITLRCITANDVWEAISFCGTFTPV